MYLLSLRRLHLNAHQSTVARVSRCAVYALDGSVQCAGQALAAGQGLYFENTALELATEQAGASVLIFDVRQAVADAKRPPGLLLAETVSVEPLNCILRLDRVTFPAGAVAWRHVHPGPGIRYLTRGALDVIADDHSTQMHAGDAWFEAADSPVKAVADENEVSEFVRVLLLPKSFTGKPSLRLLNEADLDRPRLQKNHRFFDQPLSFYADG